MKELLFRKITKDDLPMVLDWRTRENITRYMYTDIEKDMTKQKAWFRSICNNKTRLDWIIRANNEDCGVVSITDINHDHQRCSWGFYLVSDTGKQSGIANDIAFNIQEYAFEQLNLNKLCGEVMEENAMVGKWHQMMGSTREAMLREHILKNDKYHNIVVFGLLKSDWISKIKEKAKFIRGKFE